MPPFVPLRVRLLVAAVAAVGGIWAAGCSPPPPPPPTPPASSEGAADVTQQVHNFCGGSCHAYPPADSFPRRYWRAEVERGYRFFEQSGMALPAPPIESVVRYYEERAPEELAPIVQSPATPSPVRFERVSYPPPTAGEKLAISHVNLVRLPAPGRPSPSGDEPPSILACDMQSGRVMALRPSDPAPAWKVLARLTNPAHAEVVDLDKDGTLDVLVADLGSFPPTDRRCGKVVWLRGQPDGTFTPVTLLENVGRVADVQVADFRGTGHLDLIVAVFGLHAAGEIVYLENRTANWARPEFVPRVVDSRHGAIHVPVADLNGDGKPDFVALIAQEHEAVVAFLNDGGGKFRKQTLYSAPHPGWGSSGIQLTDLNGDGRLDVLYTNGDILDEPYLFKPYHGISWLENKGDMRFEHRPIAPMYGVHNAVAGHFSAGNRKGRDVVAVSFLPADKFPDRVARKADGVVLLEQVAPGKFERHPLAVGECDAVVCAVGDLYRSGRSDVVVGNFSSIATDHPVTIWKNLGPAMNGKK